MDATTAVARRDLAIQVNPGGCPDPEGMCVGGGKVHPVRRRIAQSGAGVAAIKKGTRSLWSPFSSILRLERELQTGAGRGGDALAEAGLGGEAVGDHRALDVCLGDGDYRDD